MKTSMLGGIEAGGTKFICLIGRDPDDIIETERIDVTTPDETIRRSVDFFKRAIRSGVSLEAVGIGSFGPLELRRDRPRYGYITTTPKPGWSDTDLVGPIASELGVPVGFDTDVNAAALSEGRYGAGVGLGSFVYLTVGTGVGGGAIVEGRLLHGLGHPEMGHVAVVRRPGDDFPGTCPFHGDCFEGMTSGTSIGARFGCRAETLEGAEARAAADIAGYYLASGIASLTYALSPERFVVGGGLGLMDGVLEAARRELPGRLAGYPGSPDLLSPSFVMPALLGALAGPVGSLCLAEAAANRA